MRDRNVDPPASPRFLADVVSDSLASATEGTDYAEAPPFSDEPGSHYVHRLANELAGRGVIIANISEYQRGYNDGVEAGLRAGVEALTEKIDREFR